MPTKYNCKGKYIIKYNYNKIIIVKQKCLRWEIVYRKQSKLKANLKNI